MSGKNRAFALAVATAALVGMSAPVASAATFQGGPNGFNNDSVLNLSGNQLPVQACTNGASANTVTNVQAVINGLGSVLPIVSGGAVSPAQENICTQSPTQSNTATADVTSTTPTTAPTAGPVSHVPAVSGSDPTTNGFNNDSVLNLSGNQLPVQACTNGAGVTTATAIQAIIGLVSTVPVVPVLSTGDVTPLQGNACGQTPAQTNTTSTTTGS